MAVSNEGTIWHPNEIIQRTRPRRVLSPLYPTFLSHLRWSEPSKQLFPFGSHPLDAPSVLKYLDKIGVAQAYGIETEFEERDDEELEVEGQWSFPQFSRLPVELQCRIFEFAITPRALIIDEAFVPMSDCAPPAVLQINHLSRSETRKYYRLCQLPIMGELHLPPPVFENVEQPKCGVYIHIEPYFDSVSQHKRGIMFPSHAQVSHSIHPFIVHPGAKIPPEDEEVNFPDFMGDLPQYSLAWGRNGRPTISPKRLCSQGTFGSTWIREDGRLTRPR